MGPCNWAPDYSACAGMATHPDPVLVARVQQVAVEVIWALSGRRFGLCPVTVQPIPATPLKPSLAWEAFAHSNVGGYYSGPPHLCALPVPRYVALAGPVDSITQVDIDGVTIPATEYRKFGNKVLRIGQPWPPTQDFQLPPGSPGTWTITYERGIPVPDGGLLAAATLACELFKSATGQVCALPARVTDITREGVTMTILDPAEFLDHGRTGLSVVDQWLASVNPHGLPSEPFFWSADMPPPHPVL